MKRFLGAVIALCLLAGVGEGAEYYVNGSASDDTGDGTTAATAKKTINAGIALLEDGDSLYVKGGILYRATNAGVAPMDISSNGTDAVSEAGRKHIYLDWTGTGTDRTRNYSGQAFLYGSINLSSGYRWNASAGTASLLTNGNFETCSGCTANDGSTDNFADVDEAAGTGGYIDLDTNEAGIPNGSNCVEQRRGTSPHYLGFAVTLEASTKYVLHYYSKSDGKGSGSCYFTDNATGTIFLQNDLSTWNTTSNYHNSNCLIGTSDTLWTKRSFVFSSGSAGVYWLRFNSRTNNSSVWLDDVRLVKIKEYYLSDSSGNTPNLSAVKGLWIYNSEGNYTYWQEQDGGVGSLDDHRFDWVASAVSPDNLAFNTVYVRDDSGDPDDTGIQIEASQVNTIMSLDKDYYSIYGGIFRFGGMYGLYATSAAKDPVFSKVRSQYSVQHGFQTYADNTIHYSCIADHNGIKGFQIHSDDSALNPDLDAYYYNSIAAYNGYYGFVSYGKGHYRNCISANNAAYQFYKQVADSEGDINPDEQYNIWYGGTATFGAAGGGVVPTAHATSKEADPKFTSEFDYHLKSGSPAINAGVDVGLTTDYLGLPINGLPDIGAYEFQGGVTSFPTFNHSFPSFPTFGR